MVAEQPLAAFRVGDTLLLAMADSGSPDDIRCARVLPIGHRQVVAWSRAAGVALVPLEAARIVLYTPIFVAGLLWGMLTGTGWH